jgi:hypothetical protein
MGTPSLLLALLKSDVSAHPSNPLEENIFEVVDAIEHKKPSLAKDVAQAKLYEALYSIIEDDEPYSALNSAIGKALENAISTSQPNDYMIQALREKLREAVIAALTPQTP